MNKQTMKMTLEEHRQFGETLKEAREAMMKPCVFAVGKKSSREYRAVRRALKNLDEMRNQFDNLVCRDYPECKDATRIYYGMSKRFLTNQTIEY